MKKSYKILALYFLACATTLSTLYAQKKKYPKWNFETRLNTSFNDNVFRLTNDRKDRYDRRDSDDEMSGRYTDMNSLSDIVINPEFSAEMKFRSPFKHNMYLISDVGYNVYMQNNKANFVETGLELIQEVRKKDEISLDFEGKFGFFMRNYLSDATDLNNDGNISSDEKVYSPGIYNQTELKFSYLFLLKKRNKSGPFFGRWEAYLEPSYEYSSRQFEAPLENRSRKGNNFGAELTLEPSQKLKFEIKYNYINFKSPNDEEVVLVESNNNIVRSIAKVDRSRIQKNFGVSADYSPTKKFNIFTEFGNQQLDYQTTNFLDENRFELARKRVAAAFGIRLKPSKNWSMQLEFNRKDFETFTRNIYQGYIKYSF